MLAKKYGCEILANNVVGAIASKNNITIDRQRISNKRGYSPNPNQQLHCSDKTKIILFELIIDPKLL
jgi:hypothetical protein